MKFTFRLLVVAAFTLAMFQSCSDSELPTVSEDLAVVHEGDLNGKAISGRYIVVYNDTEIGASNLKSLSSYKEQQQYVRTKTNTMLAEHSIANTAVDNIYASAIYGFSATLTNEQMKSLSSDSRVKYIEQDKIISLGKPSGGGTTPPAQTIPWGITRVNGGVDGTGKTVWVIDTGVDYTHPDLNVDVNRSKTFVIRTKTADDDNGHGSHVAGTIAAINNTIGVVGVAAGATVIAVKVLDARGSGTTTSVISGIDYVGANGKAGEVANMSLGGGVSQALDDAVTNAAKNSGVIFCLAAGNETDNANNHSPARVNGTNIYTISAMASGDLWASYSNYGNPPVDFCAPGSSILSTWKDGGYNTISGTSMATPHAAGVFLLGAARTSGNVIGDPDGNADPIITH